MTVIVVVVGYGSTDRGACDSTNDRCLGRGTGGVRHREKTGSCDDREEFST
jgi:hypothetical protein